MQTTPISFLAGSANQSLDMQDTLDTSVETGFRRVYYLRFPQPDPRAELVFPTEGTRLTARFEDLQYNALAARKTSLPGTLSLQNGHILVERPHAEPVTEIRFVKGLSGKTLSVFAMDGDDPAPQPLTQITIAKNSAKPKTPIVEQRFALAIQGKTKPKTEWLVSLHGKYQPGSKTASGKNVVVTLDRPSPLLGVAVPKKIPTLNVHRLDGSTIAEQATISLFKIITAIPVFGGNTKGPAKTRAIKFGSGSKFGKFTDKGVVAQSQTEFLPAFQPFTDANFALSRGETKLQPHQIKEVRLRGRPSGARLGLAPAHDPDAAVFFWRQPGELNKNDPELNGIADLETAFADALTRVVRDTPATDGWVEVALVTESDAPCRFTLKNLVIPYHLRISGFQEGTAKEVLKFSGTQADTQNIPFNIPANAQILNTEITLDGSINCGRLADDLTQHQIKTGLALAPAQWAATRTTLENPLKVHGLILALIPITDALEVQVSVREDLNGAPEGPILAEQTIQTEPGRSDSWLTVRFKSPLPIQTKPLWILLKPITGRGVWSAEPGKGSAAMFTESATPHTLVPIRRHDQLTGRFQWLTGTNTVQEKPSFTLQINGQEITGNRLDNGHLHYVMTTPIQSSSGETSIPIAITSLAAGQLTIYPPTIHYRPSE